MTCEAGPIDIHLKPGEYFTGDRRHRIHTYLGSCVSIALWQPERKVGAMSHFLLSGRVGNNGSVVPELDGRYAEESLLLMLRELARMKVAPADCVAKIFGGGNMFPALNGGLAQRGIGYLNGEAARVLLRKHRIPIVSESLFGVGHRQIVFDVGNGDVWARQNGIPEMFMGAPD